MTSRLTRLLIKSKVIHTLGTEFYFYAASIFVSMNWSSR